MAISIVRPPESQSQSQHDELDDDDEYDEATLPFLRPDPPPPRARYESTTTTTTITTSKGAKQTRRTDNNNDDIPVPPLPSSHLGFDYDHHPLSTSSFPVNGMLNLNGTTSHLPLTMSQGGRGGLEPSNSNHNSSSSSSRHTFDDEHHPPPRASSAVRPSKNHSTSTSSSQHHKQDRVAALKAQSQKKSKRMTSSTSNTSQPAPNNKMRAASALISKSRSLLSSTSTQQYPVGPFINSSQATRNAGVHNGNEDLSSSPDSETSGDNSKDIEEIQDTLTRAPRGENASSNGTVVSHTKSRLTLSEITETVSQNDDDEDDLVEEEEFASALRSISQKQSLSHSSQRPSSLQNGESLPSTQLSRQDASHTSLHERRPSSRIIQSPRQQKTSTYNNNPASTSPQQPQRHDSDTDDSSDEDDENGNEEEENGGTENDLTRVDHTIQQIPDSDADATRLESLHSQADSGTSDSEDEEERTRHLAARAERNPGKIRLFNDDGTEIIKRGPMAHRRGKKVNDTRLDQNESVPSRNKPILQADPDEDDLGPPLATLQPRQPTSRRRNAPLSPLKTAPARTSGRKSTVPPPTVAPRRSGRSSTDAAVRKIKVGDTFPRNSYRKLFEAAQTFIEKGEHVANLILSEMYLNDENKFEETQMAEARLQQDPDAAVRTWQIFIYCRNRKVGIKSLNSRSPLRRDPSTRMNGREGASTSPSRAQHAPSGSPAGRTLSSSSAVDNAGTGNQPTANTNDTFPSLEMPPERIYRHAKDANCPGQISAFLQVDPRALSKSIWRIEQVADHCLECVSMDMEIGKGMDNQLDARQEYFEYWSTHWEQQVKAVLAKTRNFTMLPVPKEGLTIAGNQGGSRAGQEEVEDPEEEEEEQELPIPRLSVPARKSSKRKSSARTVFQVDDWEIGPSPSPELAFNDDQPSPPKKTRFTAATSVSSSKRNLRARTLASSSRAAKGKSAFRRGSQAAALQRIEEEYDLEPHTLISDLNLPDSVNKVLTECSIFTLEDLRNAIKGDNSYFSEGTDIPVEDFLSFMQIKLSHFAKGNIGFQYDFNRENDNGANGGNTLEDDEDQEDMGDRIKRGYINDCLTILKAGRVLTRALRAVQWH